MEQRNVRRGGVRMMLVTALAVGLTACGGSSNDLQEVTESGGDPAGTAVPDTMTDVAEPAGEPVPVDPDTDGQVVTGTLDDDGTIRLGDEAPTVALPDEWPADVPQPGGFAIQSAQVVDDGAGGSVVVVSGSADDAGAAARDFIAELQAAGFEPLFTTDGDGAVSTQLARGDLMALVTASDTTIGITIGSGL